jgi:hypothetical protein
MSAHTPGPWSFRASSYLEYIYAADGSCVFSGEMDTANARLISAAPELLASLRAMLDTMDDGSDEPTLIAARAAIAKATGSEA